VKEEKKTAYSRQRLRQIQLIVNLILKEIQRHIQKLRRKNQGFWEYFITKKEQPAQNQRASTATFVSFPKYIRI
jgi:hypothetical protein